MIYEYKCKSCGTVFELSFPSCTTLADPSVLSVAPCPHCNEQASRKFSATAVVQRYNLDIRKGDARNVHKNT